ncbi:MAG: DUF2933 domain-containing protein [Chloroflexota bacterium]|nr:DUF2933 domain-containing protein [Chloroflexota bacterium]
MNMRHTPNWKRIVGMGIIALAVVAVASKLASGLIPLLFIVVCPLMMFLMMRGMGTMGPDRNTASPKETSQRSMSEGKLEEQRAQRMTQNEALARHIAPIEAEGESPHGPAFGAPPARTIPRNKTDVTA